MKSSAQVAPIFDTESSLDGGNGTAEVANPKAVAKVRPVAIALERKKSLGLPMKMDEVVLLGVSQIWRGLGFFTKLSRHKGCLIASNWRALIYKNTTMDYKIEQIRLTHAGYLMMGHRLMVELMGAVFFVVIAARGAMLRGLALMLAGLEGLLTSKRLGIGFLGSRGNFVFDTKSVSPMELSKVLTVSNGAA